MQALNKGNLDGLNLFEGAEGHKLPATTHALLSMGTFKAVGVLMAHSLLNGGHGFVGLATPIQHNLVYPGPDSHPPTFSPQDIPMQELENVVCQVRWHI